MENLAQAILQLPGTLKGGIELELLPGSDAADHVDESVCVVGSQQGGLCPAYVLDVIEGQPMWRFMQAEGAPAEACPSGFGDGSYTPLADVRRIVKIVGTAHVQGMVQRWADAVAAPREVGALLRDSNSDNSSGSSAGGGGEQQGSQ